jgi:hypothetical protein
MDAVAKCYFFNCNSDNRFGQSKDVGSSKFHGVCGRLSHFLIDCVRQQCHSPPCFPIQSRGRRSKYLLHKETHRQMIFYQLNTVDALDRGATW